MPKEPFEERMVRVPWPVTFIGRWVATELYGTHNEEDIVTANATGVMCFETENHAKLFHEQENEPLSKNRKIMEITKDSPKLFVRIYVCGASEEQLQQKKQKVT